MQCLFMVEETNNDSPELSLKGLLTVKPVKRCMFLKINKDIHLFCTVLTNIKIGNTIVVNTTIGGASNVKTNFFLYERI